ncbi:MAG: CCE_0567 family metalloprotein [Verrucomicrobiae bacterium]|nr:CCE_0567 family metalloprotein [Verrucomicrobiae bacterium]
METAETLKAEIKKLSNQAVQAKMDLHDLSEELPAHWEQIPEVSLKTFQIHEKLMAAKQRLATLASGGESGAGPALK